LVRYFHKRRKQRGIRPELRNKKEVSESNDNRDRKYQGNGTSRKLVPMLEIGNELERVNPFEIACGVTVLNI